MDEVEELGDGCLRGYVLLYKLLPFVEADLSGCRLLHNQNRHPPSLPPLTMHPITPIFSPFRSPVASFDFLKGLLEVEQSPSASRARDIFRFADA